MRFRHLPTTGVMFTGSRSVPVVGGGHSWQLLSPFAERGGRWRSAPLNPGSVSMDPSATCRGAGYGSMATSTSSSHGLTPGITVIAHDPGGGKTLGSESSLCECVAPRLDLT